MFAPPVVKTIPVLKTWLEVKKENEILRKKAIELQIISAADSAAFSTLDKFRRNKTDKQHKAFVAKVLQISDSLDIHFSWLVGIMWHESRLNHKALNSIKAVGLIQFLPGTAKGLGTSTNALYNMTGVQQLDYVYKFYRHAKVHINEMTDLYLYAFFPVAVLNNWKDNHIIEYKSLKASTLAKQNRGLDTNKDGVITVGEVRKEALKHHSKEVLAIQYK